MFETNVIVAPNSPNPRAKDNSIPVTMPGSASGSDTVAKTNSADPPSVRPATSRRRSIDANDRRIARTISGKPMIADASAAPVQRNANTMPNQRSRKPPIGPCVPNSTSSAKPTTTGGSTSGRCTIASNSVFPGNDARASRYAMEIANGRLASTLVIATRRLSATMPSSLAVGPIGSIRHLEPVLLPSRACGRRAQIVEQPPCCGGSAAGNERNRIDDRRMRCFGKPVDDLHVLVRERIGFVDDAERRFAARNERERGTHVIGAREPMLDALPHAEMLERLLRILAGWNAVRVRDRQAPVVKRGGKREARRDPERRGTLRRRDQDERISQQVEARAGRKQRELREVIHPVQISRNEDVRRRAVDDLFRKRAARRVRNHDLVAGCRFEAMRLCIHRFLETCRREDGDLRRADDRRRAERQHDECDDEGELR